MVASLAIAIALVHGLGVVFLIVGAPPAARRARIMRWYLLVLTPTAAINLTGRPCPLTVWEKHFWRLAGETPYRGGFVSRYFVEPFHAGGLRPGDETILLLAVVSWCGMWLTYAVAMGIRRRLRSGAIRQPDVRRRLLAVVLVTVVMAAACAAEADEAGGSPAATPATAAPTTLTTETAPPPTADAPPTVTAPEPAPADSAPPNPESAPADDPAAEAAQEVPEPAPATDPAATPTPEDDTGVDPSDAYFALDRVLDISIEIAVEDWDTLRHQTRTLGDVIAEIEKYKLSRPFSDIYTWFGATVTVDGETHSDVGVRKKGFVGSQSDTKPSLKLRFDKYVDDQSLGGVMERMTLNNSIQDPSMVNTCLSYRVFAATGNPAPRCNFATVSVNGNNLGLYVHVEEIKAPFLARHFASTEGNLYEGTVSDFTATYRGTIEKKNNEDENDWSDIDAVVAALEDTSDAGLQALGEIVDLDRFLSFWATEVLVGHWDGYAGDRNNHWFYREPDGRFVFIPWGTDDTFHLRDDPNPFDNISNPPPSVLALTAIPNRLYNTPEWRAAYAARLKAILESVWDTEELLAGVDRMAAIVQQHALPEAAEKAAADTERARKFILKREDEILADLTPSPPDWPEPTGGDILDLLGVEVDPVAADIGLVINEVAAKGDPLDWFELHNTSSEAIPLDDLELADSLSDAGKRVAFPPGTVIGPGAYMQFELDKEGWPGFALGGDEELGIWLLDGSPVAAVDWDEGQSGEGQSYARIPDATGEFRTTDDPTPGSANRPATGTTPATAPADTPAAAAGLGDSFYPLLGNGGYDVVHYDLELDIDPTLNTISARTEITAVATEDASAFNLDLSGLDVHDVTVGGVAAGFSRDGSELTVHPEQALAEGEEFTVAVDYSGSPEPLNDPGVPFASLGWHSQDGVIYTLSQPSGAMTWFPSNNHPSDKATFEIRITVPEATVAAATGLLIDEATADGRTTTTWRMDDPMATYLAAVYVGDFERVDHGRLEGDGPLLRDYIPASAEPGIVEALGVTGEAIDFLEGLLGPYPFDAYGTVVLPFPFDLALENQTLSVHGPSTLTPDIISHEVAHQWLGNSVSLEDWSDIWLNEGIATYLSLMFAAEHHDTDLDATMQQLHRRLPSVAATPPKGITIDELFGASVYLRGAMTMHALRLHAGDETFFLILRAHYERSDGGTTSTEEFLGTVDKLAGSGTVDLVQSWLLDEAVPDLPERRPGGDGGQ